MAAKINGLEKVLAERCETLLAAITAMQADDLGMQLCKAREALSAKRETVMDELRAIQGEARYATDPESQKDTALKQETVRRRLEVIDADLMLIRNADDVLEKCAMLRGPVRAVFTEAAPKSVEGPKKKLVYKTREVPLTRTVTYATVEK